MPLTFLATFSMKRLFLQPCFLKCTIGFVSLPCGHGIFTQRYPQPRCSQFGYPHSDLHDSLALLGLEEWYCTSGVPKDPQMTCSGSESRPFWEEFNVQPFRLPILPCKKQLAPYRANELKPLSIFGSPCAKTCCHF